MKEIVTMMKVESGFGRTKEASGFALIGTLDGYILSQALFPAIYSI